MEQPVHPHCFGTRPGVQERPRHPGCLRLLCTFLQGRGRVPEGLHPWSQGLPSPCHPQTRQPHAFRLSSLWGAAG